MSKSRLYIIFLNTLFFTSLCNAYIYRADCWANNKNRLLLLSDYHFAPHAKLKHYCLKAQKQREDLLLFLQKNPSLAIVEDLDGLTLQLPGETELFLENYLNFDPNRNLALPLDCLFDELQQFESPLISFTQCCHALNIPVVNVEFRHFTIDFLQNYLTGNVIYKLAQKTITEIASYNDTQLLNNIYDTKLTFFNKALETCKPFYNQLSKKNKPINKALRQTPYKPYLDPIVNHINQQIDSFFAFQKNSKQCGACKNKKLNKKHKKRIIVDDLFDELIDLKILHQIYKQREHKIILVLAGGAHINQIEKYLPKLGYYKTLSTGSCANKRKSLPTIKLNTVFNKFLKINGEGHHE